MKRLFALRVGVLFLIAVFLSTIAAGAPGDIELRVNEVGKIVSFYEQYYIYQINGTIEVINPSNTSIYNIDIPIYLSSLDLRANYSEPGYHLHPDELYLTNLDPLSSRSFSYRIVGISTEDLSTNGRAVLANGIEQLQPKIYSNLMGTLKKSDFEDETITGSPDTRLISVEIINPTGFTYTVAKVEVIKTPGMDPNAETERWSFTGQKPILAPYEGWSFDFKDINATEGEVYWLNTDIFIEQVFVNASSNLTRYGEEDLFILTSNETINDSVRDNLSFLADRIYLRKSVSSSLVVPGSIINVTVLVNNLEPHDVSFTVTDPVPDGFDILEVTEGSFEENEVTWDVAISAASVKRLQYSLRYTDPDSLGIDYFRPAHLVYDGKSFYSQSVPFVRQYIPEKRLFVQKNVKFLDGDEVQVTISVKNLGESALQNLMVREHLLATAEFKEISKAPQERGLWKISSLNQSEMWQTTYVTDRMSVLNTMPEVYGIAQGSILQSILLSNQVSSKFSLVSTGIAEIAAIIILAIILLMYFLPANYFTRSRVQQTRDLGLMSRELRLLREKTDKHNQKLREHRTSPALHSSDQQTKKTSSLQSPERQARHDALEKSADRLQEVKDDAGKTEEDVPEKKPDAS